MLNKREKFEEYNKQRSTLKLLNNLIKLHHDGLIITKDDDVLFSNRQVNAIFNLPQQPTPSLSKRLLNDKSVD